MLNLRTSRPVGARATVVAMIALIGLPACRQDPEAARQKFLTSGNTYFQAKQYSAAAIEYRNAIQIDPRFGAARLGLARAHEEMGDPARALAEYVRAADLLADDADVQLTAGSYLLAAARFDEAKARAESVLAREPQNVRALVMVGNALAGLKEMDQAIGQIEEAIRLDPARGQTYTNLGLLRAAQGQTAAAEAAFRRSVELDPAWVPGHLAQANHFWATDRLNEAEGAMRRAYDLEPANPLTNHALTMFYVATARPERAEPHVRTLTESGSAPFALADYYLLQNRTGEAIPELIRLRGIQKTEAEASRRLAQAYAGSGQFDDASRIVQEVLKKDARDSEALLINGQLLAREGKREESLAEVQKAVDASPESARAHFALGRAQAARGDLDQARHAFNEVLRLNPRAGEARAELARLELAAGDARRAVSLAKDAVAKEPGRLTSQLTLARSLLASNDTAGARKVLEPLLQAHPDVAELHTQLGFALAAGRDQAGARRAFIAALALEPGAAEALDGLLALDLVSGSLEAARARIDAAVASSPRNPRLLLVSAKTSAAARDWAAAERALKQAVEIDAGMLDAYTLLGQLYLIQRRLGDARREFEALAARVPKPVGAQTMLGMIALMEGNATQAEEHFERAIELQPGAPIAANNLAWLYAERGERLDLALQLAHAAVRGLPKSGSVRDTLGWVHYKRGASAQAIEAFREAVGLGGDAATFTYHLGLAQLQAGQEAEGRTSMRRALERAGTPAPGWAEEARRYAQSGSSPRH